MRVYVCLSVWFPTAAGPLVCLVLAVVLLGLLAGGRLALPAFFCLAASLQKKLGETLTLHGHKQHKKNVRGVVGAE